MTSDHVLLGGEAAVERGPEPSERRTLAPADVQRLIGAWAAMQPAGARPSETEVRHALATAYAVLEVGREVSRRPQPDGRLAAIWEVSIPAAPSDLAQRSGLGVADVRRSVELLERSAVFAGYTYGETRLLRVQRELLTADGPLALLDGSAVRRHLRGRQTYNALAVLRAIAVGPRDLDAPSWTCISNQELASTTGIKVDSVEYVVRRLREVSLLESDIEPRRLSRHRLTALAYGELIDASGPAVPAVRPEARVVSLPQDRSIGTATGGTGAASLRRAASEPARRAGGFGGEAREARDDTAEARDQSFGDGLRGAVAEEGRESAMPGARAPAHTITIEIEGVRWPLPAGVQPVLEQDADGAAWYRIGAVRLGPLRFTP